MSLPISGFTAVPNPMMLSFLATQGFAIMYYGGAGWQFGKRKVSGMSNEEVNKMSPNEFLMKLHSETRTMVPTMAQGMKDMTPLVKTTLELFGTYIREAIKAFPQVVQNILGSTDSGEFSNIPTSSGSSGNLPPQMASFLHYFATLSKATKLQIVQEAEKSKPSTITGFNVSEAQAQALEKQKDFLEDQKKKSLKLKILTTVIKTPLPIAPFKKTKKKAGQSQIMHRNLLIKNIAIIGKQLSQLPSWKRKGAGFKSIQKNLFSQQQQLVNLLDRYRF